MLCNKSFFVSVKNICFLMLLILLIGTNACSRVTSASEGSKEAAGNSSLVMEPFILNLENRGEPKYIKVSIALELKDASSLEMVKAKQAPLRDAIIALISSKTADDILSQEGKMQFKDELVLTINQILKKGNTVKNVYFTELIIQ